MLCTYDHESLSVARKAFFRSATVSSGVVRPEILASWERSQRAGLFPDMDSIVLPDAGCCISDPQLIENSLPPVHKFSRKVFLGPLFDDLTKKLDAMGAIFLGLHEDLTVFIYRGNRALVDELQSIHIGYGSNFSEKYMGTNAAVLAKNNRKDAWCIGAEHYGRCLQKYATYAYFSNDYYSRYITVVVCPRELFSDAFLGMMRYFNQTRAMTVELYRKNLELSMQIEMFNQLKNVREEAMILVDFSAKIISVNKQFELWFGLSADDVLHRDLTEILPELELTVTCLKTGKSITVHEVTFEGLPGTVRHMVLNCNPWKRNEIINGMVISLADARRFSAVSNKAPSLRSCYTFEDLVGDSPIFSEVKKNARSVASSNSSIILTGESGTGKELFAHAIHAESVRAKKSFVAVNCSAIPKELIESELFGYGDGAFTGARKGGFMGKFEFANGGTLFLDEVAELPLDIQAKLLRVLEERAIVRIGTNTVIPVDVRIISATNKNLQQLVKDNTFRLDLYYRINVINLELPPLRVRTGDILPLINFFLAQMSAHLQKQITSIAPDALECLLNYTWPGNIRQLRNVLEHGINMADSELLRLQDLPQEIQNTALGAHAPAGLHISVSAVEEPVIPSHIENGGSGETGSYEEWEKQRIWQLMQKYRANKSRIAEEMGISRGTLYKKIRCYGL